jgi:hypothetical protein
MNTMTFTFEWHTEKAALNERKHQVSFAEAQTVFDDPDFVMVEDLAHSVNEERFYTVGWSRMGRLLLVAHTDRAGRIRIISAREVTKRERAFYFGGL